MCSYRVTLHCGRHRYINLLLRRKQQPITKTWPQVAGRECWALTGSCHRCKERRESSLITCCRKPSAGSPGPAPAQERLARIWTVSAGGVMDEEEAAGPCLLLVHGRPMDWLRLKPSGFPCQVSWSADGKSRRGAWGFQAEHWKRQR